ncbi:MAG: amidohydrolase family protein [Phycisphaeraceae bacterium]|nr:amidohydrolase family protein [Phycisphaeraceae bacterium]
MKTIHRRSLAGWVLPCAVLGAFAAIAAWSSSSFASASPPAATSADVSALRPPPNGPRRLDPTSPTGVGSGLHALVGATVHTEPGTSIANATVLIRNGRIESVGDAAAPAGYRVHDCAGLHIYPGFIDAFVEVDAPRPDPNSPGVHWSPHVMPQRSVLDGATGARADDGFGAPPIDDRTAEQLRKMGFVAAGLSPRGGLIRGRAAAVSLGKIDREPSAEPPPVYERYAYMTVGLDRGGGGGGRREGRSDEVRWSAYPGSQMGAIALIRQTMLDTMWRGAGEGIRSDDWIKGPKDAIAALWPMRRESAAAGSTSGVDGWVPLAFDVADELEALRAIKIGREFDRGVVVIGSGREFRRLESLQHEAQRDDRFLQTVVLPLNFPQRPRVDTLGKADSVDLQALMDWEQGPTNPRRLDAAGVRVALTTSKVPDKAGGRNAFWKRLAEAVKHGLPKDRAMAMLTTHPAMVLGVSDRLGMVKPGFVASLVVADGDLFDHAPDRDPKAHKPVKVLEVWIDGRRHEIEPRKKHELEGTWTIEFTQGVMASPGALFLEIDDDGGVKVVKEVADAQPKQADGAAEPEPGAKADEPAKPTRQESKARDVKLVADRLTFVFEHEPFGTPGVFRCEAIVETDSSTGERVMHGLTVRASEEVMHWTAKRKAPAEPAPAEPASPERPGDAPPGADDKKKENDRGTPETDDIAAIPARLLTPHVAHGREAYPEQRHVLIIGGTVWTCDDNDRVIEDGVVRIHNGKVVFVGTRGEWADVAARARFDSPWDEVDAAGKHVTPGLIDAHSHTGISKGVNEAGQAVTAEVRIGDVTDPDSISWYRQLAGGTTTVNSMHGSANPIGGQTQTNKIRWGVEHPDGMHMEGAKPGIKFALGENVKQSNWGDNNRTRYPQTRMGVETIIRDRFTAAREYAGAIRTERVRDERARTAGQHRWPAGPRPDLELDALAEILAGERLVHCHSYRQDEILMLARLAKEFGFRIGSYQHGLECYKVADDVREAAIGASLFTDWWAFKMEVQDAIPHAGPILHDRGVVLSFNSDSDELARRMNGEAAKGVKYSSTESPISPATALRFVTINPAKQLGIEGRVGSIESGKDADVVIWSGPPLSSLSRCERTYIDGRLMFSLDDDRAMRERIARERARLIQKVLAQEAREKGAGRAGGAGAGDRRGRRGGPGTPGPDSDPAGEPDEEAEEAPPEFARSGRGSLMQRMNDHAAVVRREHYLHLLQRGLDPRFARCGDCGLIMGW